MIDFRLSFRNRSALLWSKPHPLASVLRPKTASIKLQKRLLLLQPLYGSLD